MSKSKGIVIYCIVFLISTSFSLSNGERDYSRPDPLRHFKHYNGSYDLRNNHYWASAAFTGIHGYAIAGIWLLLGLLFGSYVICRKCTRHHPPQISDHLDSSYFIIFSLILLFTILAIVASGLLLATNRSFVLKGRKLKDTVGCAGTQSYNSIQKVIIVFDQMQIQLKSYDPKTTELLNSTSHRLKQESLSIQDFVTQSRDKSSRAIDALNIGNIVAASVNLVLLIVALVLLVMHCYPGIVIIILLCWILTTLTWFLTGLDYFSHTFALDTCSALEEFSQNPENSSLGAMFPCGNSNESNQILKQIGATVHNYIFQINTRITELLKALTGGSSEALGIQQICNPFTEAPDYSYKPEQCPKNSIAIGDLPNLLPQFTCFEENFTENCRRDGRLLPKSSYVMALAFSNSIQDVLQVFPDLQNLTQCSIIKEAFLDVIQHQCSPFKRSTKNLWASILSLSIVMMVIEILWILKAYQDRGKQSSLFSIISRHSETQTIHPVH